jgi:protein-tyrosine-phosphatase/DNA-binding transcriptional ArsR family regulator
VQRPVPASHASSSDTAPLPASPERAARIFKALSDPLRIRLVEMARVAGRDGVCFYTIAQQLDMPQSSLSHHMRVLVDAGILDRERRGTWSWYRLRDEPFEALRRMLCLVSGRRPQAADPVGALDDRRTTAPVGEALPRTVLSILFVCAHNAGRSQMAAGLLQHHSAGRVDVRSAGSVPADTINAAVRDVMAEIGIDLSDAHPKLLTSDAVEASDIVVTMGCSDIFPVLPGRRYINWPFEDPAGKSVDRVRAIRDEIEIQVLGLLAELE